LLCSVTSSSVLIGIYAAIVTTLFVFIKLIVFYLHNIFDTSDPVCKTTRRSKQFENHANYPDHRKGDLGCANEEDIEMTEFLKNIHEEQEEHAELEKETLDLSPCKQVIRLGENSTLKLDDDNNQIETIHVIRSLEEGENSDRQDGFFPMSSQKLFPNDSLELIPFNRKQYELGNGRNHTAVVRKLSEPCLESKCFRWNQTVQLRSNDDEPYVRRVRSLFDADGRMRNCRNGVFFSQRTLNDCKRSTRKSFPSEVNSASYFLSDALAVKGYVQRSGSVIFNETHHHCSEGGKRRCISFDNASCQFIKKSNASQYGSSLAQDYEVPSTSKLKASQESEISSVQTEELFSSNKKGVTGRTNSLLDNEHSVSDDASQLTTSVLHRTCDKLGTTLQREGAFLDLKGDMKKFLEDPENLDAIESIKMNKFGRYQSSFATHHSLPSHLQFQISESSVTSPATFSDIVRKDGTHIAVNHDDTSQGAIHCFQACEFICFFADEDGTWWAYTFDSKGLGTAQLINFRKLFEKMQIEAKHVVPSSESKISLTSNESSSGVACKSDANRVNSFSQLYSNSSSAGSDTYIADFPSNVLYAAGAASATRSIDRNRQIMPLATITRGLLRNSYSSHRLRQNSDMGDYICLDIFMNSFFARLFTDNRAPRVPRRSGALRISRLTSRTDSEAQTVPHSLISDAGSTNNGRETSKQRSIDRLAVVALFDRNRSLFSSLFDVMFAFLISLLTGILLSRSLFYDFSLFFFAIVAAGAQFSLLKSVQPDAASPIHGFNWLAAYSRPTFFCIYGILLLITDIICCRIIGEHQNYGWLWSLHHSSFLFFPTAMLFFRDVFIILLLLLPVAFTVGLYPQVNTLMLHLMEQAEIHIFGGTACFSLISAFLQLTKSIAVYTVLTLLAYTAFHSTVSPKTSQNTSFAIFIGATTSLSWLLSRWSSNPAMIIVGLRSISKITPFSFFWQLFKCSELESTPVSAEGEREKNAQPQLPLEDPLPSVLNKVISRRLRIDLFIAIFSFISVAIISSSSVFSVFQPFLQLILSICCVFIGIMNHYMFNQMRNAYPWKCFSKPILRAHEHSFFESVVAAKLMLFEVLRFYSLIFEKSVLYPLFIISTVSINNWRLPPWFLSLFALKMLRTAFCQPQTIYIPLAFSFLLLHADLSGYENIENFFPLILFTTTVFWPKVLELYEKMSFIIIYTAPWQISWGSAFHAFAQPFSLPHTAFVIFQAILSSLLSAPLNPFLGSSFLLMSYVRPVKFWEKDYNTTRIDHSNTKLISQINQGPMLDDSNLNAVFYEHLARSLQTSLAGDLLLGRWSTSVLPGDCFILASYYLNCMVHIIEVGNGYITFQVRGLEFRGTYCHQREVEAITEDITDESGCCCCSCVPIPGLLSFNTVWLLKWLSWEIVTTKYIIDGYSITDNSALTLLKINEYRRLLVTLYVKCIIYYTLTSQKLDEWLRAPAVQATLAFIESKSGYADVDPSFCALNDEDYDINQMVTCQGVSCHSFVMFYGSWIRHCLERRLMSDNSLGNENNFRKISSFCFALSLVGRRAFATASHNAHANGAESFLYGLHALFKGDFRITSQRDEWIFVDMDLLKNVLSPAVRMALRLHQDHFTGEYLDDPSSLYDLINEYLPRLFISHEDDPDWRRAIIANTPSLLALRHMYDDGQDDYKIIMLNKMHLNLRVIKLNKECVRAFWAGQQQELIFLRNRNPERGSIQNARQVLRNMINSSADQPIGYPVYVSPLTTSYVDTHAQIQKLSCFSLAADRIICGFNFFWTSVSNYLKHNGTATSQPPNQSQSFSFLRDTQFDLQELDRHTHHNTNPSCSTPENSIVTMSSNGTSKVTLCRKEVVSSGVNFNVGSISEKPGSCRLNVQTVERSRRS
uniref:Pecanex-like protein n=1 Tax=Syphacia muris TaxID=451379 RepID=A0A0N5AAH9_9BILA